MQISRRTLQIQALKASLLAGAGWGLPPIVGCDVISPVAEDEKNEGVTLSGAEAAEADSTVWLKIKIPHKPLIERIESLPKSFTYGMKPEAAQANGVDAEVPGVCIFNAFPEKNVDRDKVIDETHFNYRNRHPNGTHDTKDRGFQYYIERSPFKFEVDSTNRHRFIASTEIRGKIKGAEADAVDLGLFRAWGFASLGFGNKWPAKFQVQLGAQLEPTSDYGISSTSSEEIKNVSNANVTSFLGCEVLSQDKTKSELQKVLSSLVGQLDREIAKISFREIVKDAWLRLATTPIRISEGVFLNVTPKQLLATPLEVDGDYLIVRCGLVAATRLSDVPKQGEAGELPKLQVVDAADKRFSLNLSIDVTAARLNKLASKLIGKSFEIGTAKIAFSNAEVKLTDDRIQLELKAILEEDKNRVPFRATILSSPKIKQEGDKYYFSPSASVEKCEWDDGGIKNSLAKLLGFDAEQMLQEQLSQFLKIDVTDEVTKVFPKKLTVSPGVMLELKDTVIQLDEVKTKDKKNILSAKVKSEGLAELVLTDTAVELPPIPQNVKLPAVGDSGGDPFVIEALWPARITGVEVSSDKGNAIKGLGIVNFDIDSHRTGFLEDRIEKVILQEGEYVTGVHIKKGNKYSPEKGDVVIELSVKTNKRETDNFGGGDADRYWEEKQLAEEGNEVMGFHGTTIETHRGRRLQSIGLIVRKRNP